MDKETGKMLNYRALLRNPKYRKDWLISAANEFGRLAQGVGNRIKGTNTIHFIRHEVSPLIKSKTSPTANLSAPSALKRKNKIAPD